MEAVANRYIRDLDPEIDSEIKSGHVMASIKKRFSDEEGDYYPYYWGAFSRHRKQSDVQLFVIIHPDRLRFGFGFGSVPQEALERFRTNLPRSLAQAWVALSAVRDRVRFRPNGREDAQIDVPTPDGLIEWAQGPDPLIEETLAPDHQLIGTPELTDEVGRVLSALHALAATAWGVPLVEEEEEPEVQEEPDIYTLEQLIADTLLPVDQLEEWIALLRGPKKQAILYGPPGTSKTWIATRLALHLAGDSDRVATVQFHPSFSYEDFIEGLRPETGREAGIAYEIRPGVFQEYCDRARTHLNETYVFVIDEINRADLGSVLGELMHLLEYRGTSIQLPYSKRRFSIPNNLILLATMNTADRSLALVDFALRRRFHAFPLPPDGKILAQFLERAGSDPTLALRFFELVQERVGRTDFAPGHSYWMLEDPSAAALQLVWRYELRPYLEEFWFENRSRLEELERDVAQMLAEEA
jgi:MoxR-like ATPase